MAEASTQQLADVLIAFVPSRRGIGASWIRLLIASHSAAVSSAPTPKAVGVADRGGHVGSVGGHLGGDAPGPGRSLRSAADLDDGDLPIGKGVVGNGVAAPDDGDH